MSEKNLATAINEKYDEWKAAQVHEDQCFRTYRDACSVTENKHSELTRLRNLRVNCLHNWIGTGKIHPHKGDEFERCSECGEERWN